MWNSLLCLISTILQIYAVSSVRTARPMSRCEIWRRESFQVTGNFIPRCNADGTFVSIQCHYTVRKIVCWKVDKHGVPTGENKTPYIFDTEQLSTQQDSTQRYPFTRTLIPLTNDANAQRLNTIKYPTENEIVETTQKPISKYQTKCEKIREKRMKPGSHKAHRIPECTKDGHFRREQCNVERTKCWCVGKSGKRIPGTKVRHPYPKCFPDVCGRRFEKHPSRHRRVVGGRESVPYTWPWQALVLFSDPKHICGGTLVRRNWLVTAASCFDKYSKRKSEWNVKLGAHKLNSSDEDKLSVEAIHIHPDYKRGNATHPGDYDVALIQVSSSARIPRNIMPLCLPDNVDFYKQGKRCSITGWGHTSYNGSLSRVLRETWVDLVPLNECNSKKSYNGVINDRFMCAGYKEGGMDACHFDTGGPLACPIEDGVWTLAGIVSWRQSCAQPYKYGVYTNVHKIKPWIEKMIGR